MQIAPSAPSAAAQTVTGVRLLGQCLAIFAAGAFGGLTYALSALLDGGKAPPAASPNDGLDAKATVWKALKGAPLAGYIWGQAGIGAGGAFAAIFAILAIGNAAHPETPQTTELTLYIVALCVVGGFVGNSLLTGVGKNLTKKLTEVQDTANQAQDAAINAVLVAQGASMDAAKRSDMTMDTVLARDLVDELEALNLGKKPIPVEMRSKAEESLKRLTAYAQTFPIDRVLNIVLSNLMYELGSHQGAVDQLKKFLAARAAAKLVENDDDATAWFNIACFDAVNSREYTGDQVQAALDEAFTALANCLRIADAVGLEALRKHMSKAQSDEELEAIRKMDKFPQLTAPYQKKLEKAA